MTAAALPGAVTSTVAGLEDVPGALSLGDCSVRIGTSSWSDRSLTHEADWYPKRTMRAAERMNFYASRLCLTEMDSTYRFPPTPAVCSQWAERTPPGFRIDVQAWSLLSEQPTLPGSLFDDLATAVREDRRDQRRLYSSHLSEEALGECWRRFVHALRPLQESDRLGTVVLRYPRWFVPRDENRFVLETARNHLGDLPAAVEFACPEWVGSQTCESTFSLLEDLDFSFVCVDAAEGDPRGLNGASATTSDVAVLRLRGRKTRTEDESDWAPDWRGYRYSQSELSQLVPRLQNLASGARELHVLFSTCWRDDAVRNAEALGVVLRDSDPIPRHPR